MGSVSKFRTLIKSLFLLTLATTNVLAVNPNYEVINEYLEKNLPNTLEPEANIAKIKEWLDGLDVRQNFKLVRDLKLLTMLEHIGQGMVSCNSFGFKLLERNEQNLWDDNETSSEANHPLRRLDSILENYAVRQFESCGLHYFNENIKLDRCLKRTTFNEINALLEKNVESDEPEANMAKAGELIASDNSQPGALTEALKLLVGLKSVVDERRCDEDAHAISVRNNLAIPFERKEFRGWRVDKLIDHYTLLGAKVCQDVYPKILSRSIEGLDMERMRSFRVLLSESLLGHSEANETAQMQFSKEFTTPDLESFLTHRSQEEDLTRVWKFGPKVMLAAMRSLAGDSFISPPDESVKDARKIVDETKLAEVYDNHLAEPCREYLEGLGRMLVHLEYHNRILYGGDSREPGKARERYVRIETAMAGWPSLFLARGLRRMCQRIILDRSYNLKELSFVASLV